MSFRLLAALGFLCGLGYTLYKSSQPKVRMEIGDEVVETVSTGDTEVDLDNIKRKASQKISKMEQGLKTRLAPTLDAVIAVAKEAVKIAEENNKKEPKVKENVEETHNLNNNGSTTPVKEGVVEEEHKLG